jgi:hypothetical protein
MTEGDSARASRRSERTRSGETVTTEVAVCNVVTTSGSTDSDKPTETIESAIPDDSSRCNTEGVEGGHITKGAEGLPANYAERLPTDID